MSARAVYKILTRPEAMKWKMITPMGPLACLHLTSESRDPIKTTPQQICMKIKARARNAIT